jgi:hypothetical protein
MPHILVYGSLRSSGTRNFNFERFGPQKSLGTYSLKGFAMFDLGGYPAVVYDPKATITVELHEVSDETFAQLDLMEAASGYDRLEVEVDGEKATIWHMNLENMFHWFQPQLVRHGDWVRHTGKK